jgi:hypothetical protein
MGYVYNELDKITDNLVQYNVNAPGVRGYLLEQLPPDFSRSYIDENNVSHTIYYKRPELASVFSNTIGFTNTYKYDGI